MLFNYLRLMPIRVAFRTNKSMRRQEGMLGVRQNWLCE